MPRKPRQKSQSGIYHILVRGINRQIIFEDDEDYSSFLRTLARYKEPCGYEIYAYCLMDNHIHILLKEGEEPLEKIMRRIGGSFVYWYNTKYERIGPLFQDRFKSEAVENDRYFLTVLRYIHQNPVKAGLVEKPEQYKWSSMSEYLGKLGIVDTAFALSFFGNEIEKALKAFRQFCEADNDDCCLELEKVKIISDREARELILKVCKIENPFELQNLEKNHRNECLKELKEKYNLSVRQISRLTGINRGIVLRA